MDFVLCSPLRPSLLSNERLGYSEELRRPSREYYHWASSAGGQECWERTSTPPYVFMTWRLIKQAIGQLKKTPWPESMSELYQPSGLHLLPKLVPTFGHRRLLLGQRCGSLRPYSLISRLAIKSTGSGQEKPTIRPCGSVTLTTQKVSTDFPNKRRSLVRYCSPADSDHGV
jgi:hypothetical protein